MANCLNNNILFSDKLTRNKILNSNGKEKAVNRMMDCFNKHGYDFNNVRKNGYSRPS